MKHGGDLLSYQHLYDGELIDFSSNINPFGYPPVLDDILPQCLAAVTAYPDIQYRELRRAIARYLGCVPEEVLVGNGSMEILDYFCQIAGRVLIGIPCFSEYRERAERYRVPVKAVLMETNFQMTAALLEGHIGPNDVVVLGNPNNPTGLRIERRELLAIHQIVEERKAFLVLDEAFFEFCPDDYDSIDLLRGKRNVCVIRAATKFFGLPGLRLGYAYAVNDIAAGYAEAALPWRINVFADLAGQHIFGQTDYMSRTRAWIARERANMVTELQAIPGILTYPTDTNFILIKLCGGAEDDLFERLVRHGLLIRKASSFEGLDASYVRLAIKDRESNRKLLAALRTEIPKCS
jgi:threonine-phosphate decarboxylase